MLDVNGLQCSSYTTLVRATAQNSVCQTFWIFDKISTRDEGVCDEDQVIFIFQTLLLPLEIPSCLCCLGIPIRVGLA